MKKLQFIYILTILMLFGSLVILEAQKKAPVQKKITKESFKILNSIAFEITSLRTTSAMTIKEVKGWSPENYDCKKKSNYAGFLACADDGTTAKIIGSGFGSQQSAGFVSSSELKIKLTVTSWSDNEINLNIQTVDPYLETRMVTLTITNSKNEHVSITLDVIGILKVKNANNTESYYPFGQSMWAISRHRHMNGKPVPESAASRTSKIDEKYEPELWDCILFDNNRMGVLIKVSPKKTELINEHEQYTWSVIVEEMNTKCDEKRSVVICKFQLGNLSMSDQPYKYGVIYNISSNASGSVKATGYYR